MERGGGGHYYTPHYDAHFSPLRDKPVTLLEIGVGGYADPNKGGQSLRMWKDYFPRGHIFGLDLYDKSALQEDRITIFQASQVDKAALDRIVNEIGGIDIIIDDGSHINAHVIETFKLLFPRLKSGGIYAVEDLQTAYWEDFGGGKWHPRNSMNFFSKLTGCLNHQEFPQKRYRPTYYDRHIVSMHFYHNLLFIYKGVNDEPSNIMLPKSYTGTPADVEREHRRYLAGIDCRSPVFLAGYAASRVARFLYKAARKLYRTLVPSALRKRIAVLRGKVNRRG